MITGDPVYREHKQDLEYLRKGLQYIDNCGAVTFEKWLELNRIMNNSEETASDLRQMWEKWRKEGFTEFKEPSHRATPAMREWLRNNILEQLHNEEKWLREHPRRLIEEAQIGYVIGCGFWLAITGIAVYLTFFR